MFKIKGVILDDRCLLQPESENKEIAIIIYAWFVHVFVITNQ